MDCITLLIDQKADPEIKSNDGKTPLDLALESENPQMAAEFKRQLELFNSLKKLNLESNYASFVENELFLEDLLDLDDEFLKSTLQLVGIADATPALIKKIRHQFRGELNNSSVAVRSFKFNAFQRQDSTSTLLFIPNPKQLAEDLTQITKTRDWEISYEDLEYTKQIGYTIRRIALLIFSQQICFLIFQIRSIGQSIQRDFQRTSCCNQGPQSL